VTRWFEEIFAQSTQKIAQKVAQIFPQLIVLLETA